LGYILGDFFSKTHLVTLIGRAKKANCKDGTKHLPTHKTLSILNFFSALTGGPGRPRVARFFLVQQTKTGKYIPNDHKIYQRATKYTKFPQKRPNDHKIYQHLPLQDP
jgi:hypothetical protein